MLRYLWVDMNSYFASVEQQESPHLRDRPVGVVPTLNTDSTCVIAASYEAKARGVKTGTRVHDAKRMCPGIALVDARPQLYVEYHHRIVDAVETCLHVDRVCSIDEMYGRLMGVERQPERAAVIAHQVKAAIRLAVGEWMRCSIGLAPNPWLSKVAADMQKPDGMTMLLAEQMPEAIHILKLTDLPGIGEAMERRLHAAGVRHVHELCRLSEEALSTIWASKVHGAIWFQQLRGADLPFRPTYRRTVRHSHVLPPKWRTMDGAKAVMTRLIHKAASRLRRINYWAGDLTVQVEALGGTRWERRIILGLCRDTLTMLQAFGRIWGELPVCRPFHVAATLAGLISEGSATQPLYRDQQLRNALADVIDRIDRKYGSHTVYFAGMWGAAETAPTRISFTVIPGMDEFG